MSTDIPTTTHRAGRRAPNWLMVVYAVLATFMFIVLVGVITGQGDEAPKKSIPACKYEDGSGQDLCIWHDGSADAVLNINGGDHFVTLDN